VANKARAPRNAPARPKTAKPAEPPKAPAAGHAEQLREELKRVNQDLSRLARASRPDAVRHQPLTEKQDLLARKLDLERKLRAQGQV
jgi:hypothetical protein